MMGMSMMPHMTVEMMPVCLEAMLPSMPKKERGSFVSMISILRDKGCGGMFEEEKKDLKDKVLGKW